MTDQYQAFCRYCGSTNVSRDAEAAWDVKRQEWSLKCVQDQGFCDGECGQETTIAMKKLPLDTEDL